MTLHVDVDSALKTLRWDDARCRNVGTKMFFDQSSEEEEQSRVVCDACPIRTECLLFGLTQRYGMWGGMTEKERRALKVEKKVVPCRRCDGFSTELVHSSFIGEVCGRCGVWWLS